MDWVPLSLQRSVRKDFTMFPSLTSNSWPSCVCLPNVEIIGLCHYTPGFSHILLWWDASVCIYGREGGGQGRGERKEGREERRVPEVDVRCLPLPHLTLRCPYHRAIKLGDLWLFANVKSVITGQDTVLGRPMKVCVHHWWWMVFASIRIH